MMRDRFLRHVFLQVIGISLLLCANPGNAQSADTPNLQMLKTDLLVVTAHPDDESIMGATMARYADEGKVVALVTCTHGEGGGNGTGREGGPALGVVREAELRKCLGILGVRHLYFLNQPDWAYTESVQATLAKWVHEETLRRLVRLVRLLRPEVICTMDPAPVGGQHGHHQAAGRLATEAFEAAADPGVFPELNRDEGLAPWRVRKLYWSSFGGAATVHIATDGVAKGTLATALPGKRYSEIAREAARQHRSQGFDKFLASMTKGPSLPARPNGFLLVKSRTLINPRSEKDLFDGIAGAKADGPEGQHDVLASGLAPAAVPTGVKAQLRPRDNVRNYRAWLQANGISRLMTRLPAQVTVVRGQSDNLVEVEITNHTKEPQTGKIGLEVPAGWALDKPEQDFSVPADTSIITAFRCAVPADASIKSHDVTVRSGEASETGRLDVVPSLVVRHLTNMLPVDADVAKWESARVEAVPITYMSSARGAVQNPQECSGRFFTGYDAGGLQVLIDVTDDTVARNIAPDDIKAHWRSTSVEICLDPSPRSENTFTTLKLGVFPEDTRGTVRGARDADAHPGPLEQIHSRIKLASRITATGYVVEAKIPWSEAGLVPARAPGPDRALGFNIILYHAGKKEARAGEDIGKSRLAWSFWPGVPGRPEVWGTAYLEAPAKEEPGLKLRMGVEQLRNPYWYEKHGQPGEARNFWDKGYWENALQEWAKDGYNALLYWPEPWTETAWQAFLIRHKDFPEARELSESEADRVVEQMQWIFHRAHELGLKNFLFTYHVTTTTAFARAHGLDRDLPVSAAVDFRHNMVGQMGPAFGVRNERTRAFTESAIAELFQTYPDLDGIDGGMGEALPGKRSTWYKEAVVPGLERSGRKPLSVVMNWMLPLEDFMQDIAPRAVYENTWLSVHANVEMLTDEKPYPMAVRWAEHAGLPTILEIVHHNHEAGFPANSPRLAYEIVREYKKVENCQGFLAWFLRSDPNDLFRKALGYYGRNNVTYSERPWVELLERRFGDRACAEHFLRAYDASARIPAELTALAWVPHDLGTSRQLMLPYWHWTEQDPRWSELASPSRGGILLPVRYYARVVARLGKAYRDNSGALYAQNRDHPGSQELIWGLGDYPITPEAHMRNLRRLGETCLREAEEALKTVTANRDQAAAVYNYMKAYKLLTDYYERKVLAAISALIYSFGGDPAERTEALKRADETVECYAKAVQFIWEEIDRKKGTLRARAMDGKSYSLPELIEKERKERSQLAKLFKWPTS